MGIHTLKGVVARRLDCAVEQERSGDAGGNAVDRRYNKTAREGGDYRAKGATDESKRE
jgi:hypothetical protein